MKSSLHQVNLFIFETQKKSMKKLILTILTMISLNLGFGQINGTSFNSDISDISHWSSVDSDCDPDFWNKSMSIHIQDSLSQSIIQKFGFELVEGGELNLLYASDFGYEMDVQDDDIFHKITHSCYGDSENILFTKSNYEILDAAIRSEFDRIYLEYLNRNIKINKFSLTVKFELNESWSENGKVDKFIYVWVYYNLK